MNFNGIAPELINGRLAMVGFLAAVGAELSSGELCFEPFTLNPSKTNNQESGELAHMYRIVFFVQLLHHFKKYMFNLQYIPLVWQCQAV